MNKFKYGKEVKQWLLVGGIGFILSLAVIVLLQLFHFQYDWQRTFEFLDYRTRLHFIQAGIVFILFLWLWLLTRSIGFTSVILLFLTLVIGISSQQKMIYRGEPLYPSDTDFLKDVSFLFEMVELPVAIGIVSLFLVFIASTVFFFIKRKKRPLSRKMQLVRWFSFGLVTFILVYISQFNQPGNKVKAMFNEQVQWVSYSQEKNYSENGFVSGLLYNFVSPAVDRPDDYSKERIARIFEKYQREAETKNAARQGSLDEYNIIYIMNETFSDPMRIDGVNISKDPIPLLRQTAERHKTGLSLSQGYGGGTANIEFEALTGVSLEPFSSNITTPFIQLSEQIRVMPSITDFVKEAGHHLTAIHPYNSTMYKRKENYQSLHFESVLFQEDMTYTDRIDENTFISDEASYREVLDVLESTEEKDFIHLVTMQNHKPFVHKYEDVEFEVEGAPYNLEVAHYVCGKINLHTIAAQKYITPQAA